MNTKLLKIVLLVICITLCFASCDKKNQPGDEQGSMADKDYTFPLSLQKEAEHSLEIAFKWLLSQQFQDGSWKSNPAIASLVLYSLVEMPGYIAIPKSDEAIKKGFDYLRSFVREDGGIYQNEYRNYTTSVALLAFATYNKEEDKEIIKNAKDFLILYQCDESEDYTEDDPFYGGIGYGGDERPDLSNTQLALDAIKAAEDYEARYSKVITDDAQNMELEKEQKGLHWEKALIFLARCQNAEEVNTMDYRTENDGGFMYETGTYNDDRSHSYGSMTYAGVKSLLYADIDHNDIRVKRALEWIKNNYTLEENPGFGTTSIYYYYMTFSKCLSALGGYTVVDKDGKTNPWREDIVKQMISLQKEDGYWENSDGRYWENMKELATSYSIVAIKFAFRGLSAAQIK
jgi:squalene-hopene/tetraprenyl-beta-curcumene cyclase